MLGANVTWGVMSPVAKFIMAGGLLSPLVVTELRIGGAMLLFWLASLFTKPERVAPKDMLKLFGASLLAIIFNQGSFIFGVSLTSPVNASIITTSMPLLAMILAAIFLKEPISGRKVMGIATGACGALLLILGGVPAGSTTATTGSAHIWGDLLVLTAQLSYALYFVLFKNFASRYSPVTMMKWMFTFAFLCTIPFSYQRLADTRWSELDASLWGGVVLLVAGATFFCYLMIVIGQKNLRPTVAGMYNYVQPLVACIVAVCWGMESFSLTKALSAVLIFGGVWLVTTSPSRQDLEAAEAAQATPSDQPSAPDDTPRS